MAPSRKIVNISSDEDDRCWVGKKNQSSDSDDDCVILDGDPDKSVRVVNDNSANESDELLIVAEKGQIACRDYPHARHLCARFPFSTNPHEKYCDLCHCYVCDTRAPCVYWGIGKSSGDHCHSTDKEEIWRVLRQSSKQGKMAQLPASTHPATTLLNAPPLHPAPNRSQSLNSNEESGGLLALRLALDRLTVQADRLTGTVKWFDSQKGYGFITPDSGGEDLFVHQSSIKSKGYRSLEEGEAVEFKIERGDDGRNKAIDVSLFVGETTSDISECYKCGEVGHIARNCSSSECYKCGEMGHFARDCSSYECYKCGERGHFARDCSSYECYKCGERGHFARDCSYTGSSSGGSVYDGSETSESHNCGETGQLGLRDMVLDQLTVQADRLTGTVKWFDWQKGYGFITTDNGGEDLFVHKSSIKSKRYRSLVEGEAVEFKIESGDWGRNKAIDVSGPGGSFVQGTTSNTSECYICGETGHFARNCSYTGSSSGDTDYDSSETSESHNCIVTGQALDQLTVQADRLTGTVKWFDWQKGYGFITPDNGCEDLFVHKSSIKSKGHRSLVEGEVVEFKIESGDCGRNKAIDVSCPGGSFVQGTTSNTSECYICGETGHFARNCSYTGSSSGDTDYDSSGNF